MKDAWSSTNPSHQQQPCIQVMLKTNLIIQFNPLGFINREYRFWVYPTLPLLLHISSPFHPLYLSIYLKLPFPSCNNLVKWIPVLHYPVPSVQQNHTNQFVSPKCVPPSQFSKRDTHLDPKISFIIVPINMLRSK